MLIMIKEDFQIFIDERRKGAYYNPVITKRCTR